MATARKMTWGVAGAAVAALMAVLVAQPAAASDGLQTAKPGNPNSHTKFCVADKAGTAWGCFQPYGEVFRMVDLKKDGYGAFIYWSSSSGRSGQIHDHLGKGRWGYVNKSFGESTKITFRTCSLVGERPAGCGNSRTVPAGLPSAEPA
ncbi:MAG: hypothetical protein WCA46_22730 [Actinocatenispora sp.]